MACDITFVSIQKHHFTLSEFPRSTISTFVHHPGFHGKCGFEGAQNAFQICGPDQFALYLHHARRLPTDNLTCLSSLISKVAG